MWAKSLKVLIVIALVVGGLAGVGFAFLPGFLRLERAETELLRLEQRVNRSKEELESLRREEQRLQNDENYQEFFVRTQLKFLRTGEVAYRVRQ